MKNMKGYDYNGYTFYLNGTVTNAKGEEIHISKDKYGGNYVLVKLYDNSGQLKAKKVYIARILYSFFHNIEISTKQVMGYHDGDKSNCHIENLYLKNKEDVQIKHSSKCKVLTETQVKEIRSLYQNRDKHFRSQWNKDSYSLRDLATKYCVSLYTIQKVINGSY